MPKVHRRLLASSLILSALLAVLWLSAAWPVAAENLPQQISDETFWQMIVDFSEPGGYFRSDNFVSNETTFQYVIPDLKNGAKAGGVYLGVGPDQNFTYLVALQPKIAFIVDIRRQNMLQHLMYKALIELSADRAEFLSRLFSRKRPAELAEDSMPAALFEAYSRVIADRKFFDENIRAVFNQLEKHHGFKLTAEDRRSIEYVYGAFYAEGPDLTYSFSNFGRGGRRMPTYSELMVEDDGHGVSRSYLASEANFSTLRDLQKRNLVVPLVGDFAGDKAIRSVGRYLKEHGATITAVYTSNVEQYLFQQDDNWRRYYGNVAALPVDSASTFIRAVFNMGYFYQGGGPAARSATLLCPIQKLLKAFEAGEIRSYYDVVRLSQ